MPRHTHSQLPQVLDLIFPCRRLARLKSEWQLQGQLPKKFLATCVLHVICRDREVGAIHEYL